MRNTIRDLLGFVDRRSDPGLTGTSDEKMDQVSDAAPGAGPVPETPVTRTAFGLGDIVRHRFLPFRGVVYDVDPEFQNTEEWWQAIPEAIRPAKDQPFYHILAEGDEASHPAYVAYVSEQNLVPDASREPVGHPAAEQIFERFDGGAYRLRPQFRQ